MRRITIALTIILVGASLAASSRTTAQTANTAAEEQMIRQLSQQWVAAAATKDPAAVVKFYADDGVLLPQGAPLAEGHCQGVARLLRSSGFLTYFQFDENQCLLVGRHGL